MTATVNITCAKDGTVLASNLVLDNYTCPNDVVVPPPVDYVSVRSTGAIGDGVADDTVAVQKAFTQAKSEGKKVYIPAGEYRLTSTLATPSGIMVFGDGWNSHLVGHTHVNSTQVWKDLYMGASSDAAIGLPSTTMVSNVRFDHVRFRGGNQKASCITVPGGYYKMRDWTWTRCGFEAPDTPYTVGGVAHAIQVSTDPRLTTRYGIADNIVVEDCYFGLPSEKGDTSTNYGWIIFYENANYSEYGNAPGTGGGYHDNIYIRNNYFGKSQQWGIDIANQSSLQPYPDNYPYLKFFIENNLFTGAGVDYEQTTQYEYSCPVTFEAAMNSRVTGNIFYRSRAIGSGHLNMTKKVYRAYAANNIFDMRVENGVIPAYHGEDSQDRMYRKVIRTESLRYSTIQDNKLFLPNTFQGVTYTNKGTNQSWVYMGSAPVSNVVTGNTVSWGGEPPNYEANYFIP